MRHNQQGRRFRGRNNNHGGNHNHNNHGRRVNPRVQTFDSNGPDVRIRGNASQVAEKYVTLARDAASAGDRVLAESYLQHAEHYQRLLNEMNDDYNRQQQQAQQQPQQHGTPMNGTVEPDGAAVVENKKQPRGEDDGMSDLDQGFLVGPRGGKDAAEKGEDENTRPQRNRRQPRAAKEAETA